MQADSARARSSTEVTAMDAYVKTVLTVIAACLLLQVAQGFGLAGTPGQTESSSPETANRYVVQAIPMARVLLRLDLVTGQTWTMPLQQEKGKLWIPVDEPPPELMLPDEDEGVPSRPGEAGETGE
jgi:hypothetical protein